MDCGEFRRMQCDGCKAVADIPAKRPVEAWGALSVDIRLEAPGSRRHQWISILDLCPRCLAALAENGRLTLANFGGWSPEQQHDIGDFVLGMVRDFLTECLRRGYPRVDQNRPDKEA